MHIKERHPDVAPYRDEVMRAVREPEQRRAGRRPFEEWFFLEWRGPSRWLHVVVHYEHGQGSVRTAFPETSI